MGHWILAAVVVLSIIGGIGWSRGLWKRWRDIRAFDGVLRDRYGLERRRVDYDVWMTPRRVIWGNDRADEIAILELEEGR